MNGEIMDFFCEFGFGSVLAFCEKLAVEEASYRFVVTKLILSL
jgi:hypothetical protein